MYDYIIVGAGVAGAVCAYALSKSGSKCLVLEKHAIDYEKVCGGGVSYKALRLLKKSGIDCTELMYLNSKQVNGHIIYKDNQIHIKDYKQDNISIGIQRNILDRFLMRQAVGAGAHVRYNEAVKTINKLEGGYCINNYVAKNVVMASGARPFAKGEFLRKQSIGYSAQIKADMLLNNNKFYYWYYSKNDESKYFWVFPIGDRLWNIGVWSRYWYQDLRYDYNMCVRDILNPYIVNGFEYYRKPRAEFLGHVDQRKYLEWHSNGIGDFAGNCNPLNGGGIVGAIESAIMFAQQDNQKF